ncbi:MAG: hypothetical protein ACLR6B_02680 [Blautia sp.]
MFQVNYCEYNRSNADCDRIYRPGGSGDYLLLLLKTPMKCRLKGKLEISGENAFLLYAPGEVQDYQAVQKFRNSYVHFQRIFRSRKATGSRPLSCFIRKIFRSWMK